MIYHIKKIKPCQLNLTVALDRADLDNYLNEAQKYLANDLRIKGFRRGKAPVEIAKGELEKKQVLKTAFDFAFKQTLAEILEKEKIDLIDAGDFEVKENSSQKITYSVILTVFPEFKLAKYRAIQVKKKDVSISEEEIGRTLEFIRNSKKINGFAPELNDDFAKSLGRFENLSQLKDSVKNGLRQEKEKKESQRIQSFVLDSIAENTKIEVPPFLIIRQLDQMMLDLDADLHRQGLELGLFLAKIKKTQDQLRDQWKLKAELLVKKALILKEIARVENIKVESEEVKERTSQFLQSFTTVEEAQKQIDLPKLSNQIQQILLNEKVLIFLGKEARPV